MSSEDERSEESDDLPLSRLKTVMKSKGCTETIDKLQKAVKTHENRKGVLKSMKERRKAVAAKVKKAQTSNTQEPDESSDESWIDVNSQDEEENPTVWIKEEEDVFEEREGAKTEGAEVPAEAPQRRTSTGIRKPTQLFGSGVYIQIL